MFYPPLPEYGASNATRSYMHVFRTNSLSGATDQSYKEIEKQVKQVATHRNIIELEYLKIRHRHFGSRGYKNGLSVPKRFVITNPQFP